MNQAVKRRMLACMVATACALPLATQAETIVAPSGAVVTLPPVPATTVPPVPEEATPAPAPVVVPGRAVVVSPAPLTAPAPVQVAPSAVVVSPVPSVAPVAPAYDDLDAWVDRYALTHGGYITREDYLREMARRWDASDIDNLGLTPAEMSHLTGHVDTNALAPLSGSGAQPGNMGPGNSRGK